MIFFFFLMWRILFPPDVPVQSSDFKISLYKLLDNHSFFQGSFHRLFPINICTIPSDLQFNIGISRPSLGWNWSKILGDFWAQ